MVKRFEVQTQSGYAFERIDVPHVLAHIGESFPNLEQFVIDFGGYGFAVRYATPVAVIRCMSAFSVERRTC